VTLPHLSRRSLLTVAAAAGIAVVLVVVIAVAAPGGGHGDPVRTAATTQPQRTPVPPPTTRSPAPPAGSACPTGTGVVCRDEAAGDVDGDGRRDRIALWSPEDPDRQTGPFAVRVVYATGRTEEVEVAGNPALGQILGVTDLDGDGRGEVAYVAVPGAHTYWGGFLGTGGTGRLHRVGFAEETALVDASAAFSGGFSCPDADGDGRRDLVVVSAGSDGRTVEVHRETYRWQADRLAKVADTTDTVLARDGDGDGTEDAREGIAGVDCPGLRAPDPL
jgi:hypothetical protein